MNRDSRSDPPREVSTKLADSSPLAYSSPRLLEYGSIAKLTLGAGSNGNDGGIGFKN